jgi:flavin-dependent dehydrogenase
MPRTWYEPARAVEVLEEVDVIVAGGGVSGCAAAWAAAKAGARTVLVERNGCLGGVATASLMANIGNMFLNTRGDVVMRGFAMDVLDRAAAVGAASPNWKSREVPGCTIDSERFKVVLIEMLQEAGVTVLTHALGARPIMDEAAVRGVFVESKSGRQALLAKAVVDCTGEADLAWQAGAEVRFSRSTASTLFALDGVDVDAFLAFLKRDPADFPAMHDFVKDLATFERNWRERGVFFFPHVSGARGDWPALNRILKKTGFDAAVGEPDYRETRMGMYAIKGGSVAINSNVYLINDLDVRNLSRLELHAQRMCYRAAELMRKHVPGFEASRVAHIGADLGVRGSRSIVGQETLSGRDVRNAPGPTRRDSVIGCSPVRNDDKATGRFTEDYTFDVPYGILLPKGCENLLVASGKSVGTQPAGVIRGMSGCMACGQAAGAAAALAARTGVSPSRLPVPDLQRELLAQGVYLGDAARLKELGLAGKKRAAKG